ncbi:transposase [Streptomyces rhizosphaericola]|uniref:transposase n=1 Tax=Streptomyces rhizosphaericola TaxID=2564098 RepID=UPI0039EED928
MPDDLWERMELLVPCRERRSRHPGRKPLPDRQALRGILFVSHTRIQWDYLPEELGFASGMARRRRLRDGNGTGVRQQQLIVSAAVNRNRGAGEDHQAPQAGSRQPRLPSARGHGQPRAPGQHSAQGGVFSPAARVRESRTRSGCRRDCAPACGSHSGDN